MRLRKSAAAFAASTLACIGGGTAMTATSASAYGGDGQMGVYQVGLSFNCDKFDPSSPACQGGEGLGGFWGWAEFDSPANDPTSGTGGDAVFEGCSHSGGFNGAGHEVMDIHDWTVAPDPDMGGLPTFFASWTEIDTFNGQSMPPVEVHDKSTGIPAMTVHRKQLQLFGQPTPPGSSINVEVSWKPAH